MKINKKDLITTGLAVTLALGVLIGGGTYSYLQDSTGDTVNTFDTNKVTVDLSETTGNSYNIIPGTEQDKDPKVTVDNSVDAYVYVEVTDKTEGLVTYEIAEGWDLMPGYSELDTKKVYYRVVEKDDDNKSFNVLANNVVTYDASKTNSDMLDNGKLKDGIELTFTAKAVQKQPFDKVTDEEKNSFGYEENEIGAIKAYTGNDSLVAADSVEDINTAIGKGEMAVLTEDIDKNATIEIKDKQSASIYLNGHSLTDKNNHAIKVENGGKLIMSGSGTVDATAHTKAAIYNEGGTVVLEGGTYTRSAEAGIDADHNGGNSYYAILNHGTMTIQEGVVVKAEGGYSSLIENGWQDGNKNTSGKNSVLIINGGTFIGGLNTIKNDDYGYLTINGGIFTNHHQYALMNYNIATIKGGTFISTVNSAIWNCYADSNMDKGELTINGGNFSYPSEYYGINNSYQYSKYGLVKINTSTATFATQRICNKYDVISSNN